jgi:hypothetical protein
MFKRLRPGPGVIQRLRHWTSELLVVAIGVLLALWAQAWFEARRDADSHRETLVQLDRMFHRALVVAAARVSTADCARRRIAELDAALRVTDGQWNAMPIPDLPAPMRRGRFPPVYLADAEVLPTALFDLARANGTLAALPPASRAWYEQAERQLTWLREAWAVADAPKAALSLLAVDGPLGETARDAMRQALVTLDNENHVVVIRAASLARLARERGITLGAEDLAAYREKLARDRGFFGACVVEVDPLSMEPAQPRDG